MSVAGRNEFRDFVEHHPEIRWVDTVLPDICGIPRGKRLDINAGEKLYTTGMLLPGSTAALDVLGNNIDSTGMGQTDGDPDYPCHAVANTLVPVPWSDGTHGQVLVEMRDNDGNFWWLDQRCIVKSMLSRIEKLGFRIRSAFELEFYLVDSAVTGKPVRARSPVNGRRPTDTQVYLLDELDAFGPVLNDMISSSRLQNIPSDVATIEYAPGQFEINLHYTDDPVTTCDHAFLQKRAIKGVGSRHGMISTFMARPFPDTSTSGTHLHLSLIDDSGRNLFDDGTPQGSELMRHAIGGLRTTMKEGMSIWAPNANSYRRITPDGWAPLAPTWGYNNRTVSLRIPGGPSQARRIEHRTAGADANPYLVMAAVLAGMHHGIVNSVDPGEPSTGNAAIGATASLPSVWVDSLREFDRATILPEYFGSRWWDVYSKLKWSEFLEFNNHISQIEYDRLLTLV